MKDLKNISLIFLTSLWLFSAGITKPFVGNHDWNGVFFGAIARNYLDLGLATKLGMVTNSGPLDSNNLNYYTNHPVLMPLILATSLKIFGSYDWALRLVPVLFSCFSMVLLYQLGANLANRQVGIIAALALSLTPMMRYFSKMPNHEPLVLFFILLTIVIWQSWLKKPSRRKFNLILVIIFIGSQSGWAYHFLAPLLSIATWLLAKRKHQKKPAIIFLTIDIFSGILTLTHIAWLNGFTSLISAFLFRIGISPQAAQFPYTPFSWINLQRQRLFSLFTFTLVLSSFIYITSQLLKKTHQRHRLIIMAMLFLFGLAQPLIFHNQAFIHEYLLFYLGPFIALSFALILRQLIFHLPKSLHLPIIIAALALISLERRQFLSALLNSYQNDPGYQLGQLLNHQTQFSDKILVTNSGFGSLYSYFVQYYANRNIVFAESADHSQFDFVVTISNEHTYNLQQL